MIIINIQAQAVSQTPSLHFYDELQPQQGSSGMSQVYTDKKKNKGKTVFLPKGSLSLEQMQRRPTTSGSLIL